MAGEMDFKIRNFLLSVLVQMVWVIEAELSLNCYD